MGAPERGHFSCTWLTPRVAHTQSSIIFGIETASTRRERRYRHGKTVGSISHPVPYRADHRPRHDPARTQDRHAGRRRRQAREAPHQQGSHPPHGRHRRLPRHHLRLRRRGHRHHLLRLAHRPHAGTPLRDARLPPDGHRVRRDLRNRRPRRHLPTQAPHGR